VKEQIGFICVGQAGGNIGQIFEKHEYTCLFINSSQEDLDTLDVKFKYHFDGATGCNKDRSKGIELVKKNLDEVLKEFESKLLDKRLIFLIFSTSGGTGGGSGPILLDSLINKYKDKTFGCICILPSLEEPLKAQINAIECYNQLTNIRKLGAVFTLDNNKVDKYMINSEIVRLFNAFLDVPNHKSTKGNIDKAELWQLLTTRGNIVISTSYPKTENATILIINSIETSIFAPIEKDRNVLLIGLSLTNDINEQDFIKYIGLPLDTYYGYNRDQNVIILSGLSFPITRLNQIYKIVNNNKEHIKNNLINSKTAKTDFCLDWLSELKENNKTDDFSDLEDVFSKYE
jgi:hypothetical protein